MSPCVILSEYRLLVHPSHFVLPWLMTASGLGMDYGPFDAPPPLPPPCIQYVRNFLCWQLEMTGNPSISCDVDKREHVPAVGSLSLCYSSFPRHCSFSLLDPLGIVHIYLGPGSVGKTCRVKTQYYCVNLEYMYSLGAPCENFLHVMLDTGPPA